MKRKVVWGAVSGWMVAALLLASCAPTVVEEPEKEVIPPKEVGTHKEMAAPKEVIVPKEEAKTIKWTGTKKDGTTVEKMIGKPKYGGIHIVARPDQPEVWDSALYRGYWQTAPVTEPLLTADWLAGPAGTEEWFDSLGHEAELPYMGMLSTGWERPDPDTLIYHIRQGIHYALDPSNENSRLVGGRELTADDVVAASVRNWTIGYYSKSYKYISDLKNPANSIYVSPDDPWAVIFKSKPGGLGLVFRHASTGRNQIIAPEMTEKYGEIKEWEQVVGTGPFMLEDYVGGSSVSYVKNPNYWGRDPFFPENKLPYLDGLKVLVIPDISTQQAALRTGKVDYLTEDIDKEQRDQLLRSNPELQTKKFLGAAGGGINMRLDKPELPWHDVRVRRALAMAIDNVEIRDTLWAGEAEIHTYPIGPKPEGMYLYTPLEEMPRSVQELFEYHPDKAKELLAEAGYPDG
ncbi:MAG: ABC transporter substrate-binding protein, partial [Dehalococcoidales bacterium]|nr:ABC transporter substrate-binding protein [Dehalococcoidales bacterium]